MAKNVKRDLVHSLFRLKSTLNTDFCKDTRSAVKDISLSEYVLMNEIEHKKSDLTAVREYLSITKSAVSQMLGGLEKKGYLVRRTNALNRRNIVVQLTDAGRAALREKEAEFDARYNRILGNMQEVEAEQLLHLLDRLQYALALEAE